MLSCLRFQMVLRLCVCVYVSFYFKFLIERKSTGKFALWFGLVELPCNIEYMAGAIIIMPTTTTTTTKNDFSSQLFSIVLFNHSICIYVEQWIRQNTEIIRELKQRSVRSIHLFCHPFDSQRIITKSKQMSYQNNVLSIRTQ